MKRHSRKPAGGWTDWVFSALIGALVGFAVASTLGSITWGAFIGLATFRIDRMFSEVRAIWNGVEDLKAKLEDAVVGKVLR
jgi:hypothetical protein